MGVLCFLLIVLSVFFFWRECVSSQKIKILKEELNRQKKANEQLRSEIFIWSKKC